MFQYFKTVFFITKVISSLVVHRDYSKITSKPKHSQVRLATFYLPKNLGLGRVSAITASFVYKTLLCNNSSPDHELSLE